MFVRVRFGVYAEAPVAARQSTASSLRPLLVRLHHVGGLRLELLADLAESDVDGVPRRLSGLELLRGFGEGLPTAGAEVCFPVVDRSPELPLERIEPGTADGGQVQELSQGDPQAAGDTKVSAQPGVVEDGLAS